MPRHSLIDLRFPAGGLDRRFAYREQKPFTSPVLQNVRPDSTVEARERGGSRPGLSKAFYTELPSAPGKPIRLLEAVRQVRTDGYTYWDDGFQGSALGGVWTAATWIDAALPNVLQENVAGITFGTARGAVRSLLTNLDTSKAYYIGIYLVPFQGAFHGTYQIFLRMDNTTPNASVNGTEVRFISTGSGGSNSGSLISVAASVPTTIASFSDAALGSAKPGWLVAKVSANTVAVFRQGVQIGTGVVAAPVGSRVGFGLSCTVPGGACLVSNFRAIFFATGSPQISRNLLCVSSDGKLFIEDDTIGTLRQAHAAGPFTLNNDRLIQGVDRGQKLYIADNGNPKTTGADGTRGTANDRFDAASVGDWSVLSISINDDVLVVTDSTDPAVLLNGVYQITVAAAGELTVTPNVATGATAATAKFRVERGPKIYDPLTDTISRWMTTPGKGHIPVGCPLIARFRDRLVLAGAPVNPTLWNMLRQGDPLDNDTGADDSDAGRAVAGNTSDAGLAGEPITSLMTYSDDYLQIGAESSLWVIRGDPAGGGSMDAMSRSIGVISGRSWCVGPSGEIYFLSRDGIYVVPGGGGQIPAPVSREKLPRELIDIDPLTHIVTMAYDVRRRGLLIFVSSIDKANTLHWWFDLETKGFFQDKYTSGHEPTALLQLNATISVDACVLLGCRDGFLRRHQDFAETDDGTTIDSFVFYGPMRAGGDDYNDGMVAELVAVLGKSSGNVTLSVFVADTHEELSDPNLSASFSKTIVEKRNYNIFPRRRGGSWALKLSNQQTNRSWFVESMTAKMNRYRKHRVI